MDIQFAKDVIAGLTSKPKHLSSKYFYDTQGDFLFQKIMQSEDYYLPECELEIFANSTKEILDFVGKRPQLSIIELGAGDGTKTSIFLKNLSQFQDNIDYIPFDISPNVLIENEHNIRKLMPQIRIEGISGDYFQNMHHFKRFSNKLVLFLGSNIGNFNEEQCHDFMALLRSQMEKDDVLIVAVDLKKDPNIILRAYNDHEGWTSKFNFNLLTRINRELDGDLKEEKFIHYPTYDPVTGECRSYLISKEAHGARINGRDINFLKEESILMEISKKFDLHALKNWANIHDFSEVHQLTDSKGYYSMNLYKV